MDKIVIPVLLYGCDIWGHRSIDKLEVFYRNFLKNILNTGVIRYWLRLLNKKHTTLAYIYYILCLWDYFVRRIRDIVVEKVKNILDNCGLSYMWHNQQSNDIRVSKAIVNGRIEDVDIQRWSTSISTSSVHYV